MKLIINTAGNLGGGGLQVAISFIYECIKFVEHEYHIFLGVNVVKEIDKFAFPDNFYFYDIPLLKFYEIGDHLTYLEKKIHPEIVISVFGPSYYRPKVTHIIGFAQGYYIYSESPFLKTLPFFKRIKIFLKRKVHLMYFKYDGDVYICETEDATARLRKIIGDKKKYFTVSNTYSSLYLDKSLYTLKSKLPNRKPNEFRFLTLCKYYPHKNIQIIRLILDDLFRKNIYNIVFVLTIDFEEYSSFFGLNYINNVITVGSVFTNECPSLYNECDAMFLPSLVECFSASYPEAMIMKKPILTSDLDFAHSICDNAALYFDPFNIEEAVVAVNDIVNNQILRLQLIENGLKKVKLFPSAQERANCYLTICEQEKDSINM